MGRDKWSAAALAGFLCLLTQLGAYGEQSYRPLIGINVDVAVAENQNSTACKLADGGCEGKSSNKSEQRVERLHLEKPLSYSILSNYVEAVRKAGGLPVLLPPMAEADFVELAPRLDGLLMIGGDDYPPQSYGEKTEAKTVIMSEERWKFDLAAVRTARKMGLPYLGICAGCQALNIASGGTLVQDIPQHFPQSKVSHASKDGWQTGFNRHAVSVEPESRLASILGGKLDVVTSHHQCIGRPGSGLKIVARSEDGLPEAIEVNSLADDKNPKNDKVIGQKEGKAYCFGVQWHPERDFSTNKALFESFIEAAVEYHRHK